MERQRFAETAPRVSTGGRSRCGESRHSCPPPPPAPRLASAGGERGRADAFGHPLGFSGRTGVVAKTRGQDPDLESGPESPTSADDVPSSKYPLHHATAFTTARSPVASGPDLWIILSSVTRRVGRIANHRLRVGLDATPAGKGIVSGSSEGA